MSFLLETTRARHRTLSTGPFIQLVRLFAGRIFYGNNDSGEDELSFGMGSLLALLSLPGGFYSIFLFEKYSTLLQWMRGQKLTDPLQAVLPDEYFFIVLSMAVSGVIAVWRWDSIFPDRRDYTNLVPLPLPMRNIFLASLVSIVLLTFVLAIDVNAASAFLFPLAVSASVDSFGFFVHFIGVHVAVVLLASAFSSLAVFLVVGAVMLMPSAAGLPRFSLYVRGTLIASFVALLATSFAVPVGLQEAHGSYLRFLPPVWFVGLCRLLQGQSQAFASLGQTALVATGIAFVGALLIYAISYRRRFMRIPESREVLPSPRQVRSSRLLRLLDRTILTSSFQQAGYRFVMKTMFRSERHSLVLAGFAGLGLVTASQFLASAFQGTRIEVGVVPSPQLLAIPLILSYCIALGTRLTFEVPSDLRANWIFRLCLDKSKHESAVLAVKVILTFILPWTIALALPAYGYLWGWRVGLFHTAVVCVWSVLLSSVLLLRFRSLPFTRPYPPFREGAIVHISMYVFGFFVYVIATSQVEYWALFRPALALVLIAVALGTWFLLFHAQREMVDVDKDRTFGENPRSSFELLDLSSRG